MARHKHSEIDTLKAMASREGGYKFSKMVEFTLDALEFHCKQGGISEIEFLFLRRVIPKVLGPWLEAYEAGKVAGAHDAIKDTFDFIDSQYIIRSIDQEAEELLNTLGDKIEREKESSE